MSVVAPVTVAWQRVEDKTLPDQNDNQKRVETFSSLESGISRARQVIEKANDPNDAEFVGSNPQAHITLHPGNFAYGDTLVESDLEDVYITLLPGAFTGQATSAIDEDSRENIADLNSLASKIFFAAAENELIFDSNVTINGDLGFEGNILNFDTASNNTGGIRVSGANSVSDLLYDVVQEEWRVGEDTVIDGTLTADNLNIDGGISGELLPDGVPTSAVTFVGTGDSITGKSSFTFDQSTDTLSVSNLSLQNGTSVNEIKTVSDAESSNALVTESALQGQKVSVSDDSSTILSSPDDIAFVGAAGATVSVTDDGDNTATIEIESESALDPNNFVSVSGDTMTGDLTLEQSLNFTTGTPFQVNQIKSSVGSPGQDSVIVTEAAVRDAVQSASADISAGQGITISGSTISHEDTSSVTDNTDSSTFISEIGFDSFGHVTSIGTDQVAGSIAGGNGITVTQSGNQTVVNADLVQDVASAVQSVLAGSFDPNADNGTFRSLDTSGTERYSASITSSQVSSITTADTFVFIGEDNSGTQTAIHKYDYETGSEIDVFVLGSTGPAPVAMATNKDDTAIYVMLNNNEIRKYDLEFNELWNITPTDYIAPGSEASPFSISGDTVYVTGDAFSSSSNPNSQVVKLTDGGSSVSQEYAVNVGGSSSNGFMAIEISPDESSLFVTDQENNLRKLNESDGTEADSRQIRTDNVDRRGRDIEFLSTGNFVVGHGNEDGSSGGTLDGLITKYDQSLVQLNRITPFGNAVNQLAADGSDNIYAGSDTGEIKAFDVDLTELWTNTDFQTTSDARIQALEFTSVEIVSENKPPSEKGIVDYIDEVKNNIISDVESQFFKKSGGVIDGNTTINGDLTVNGELLGVDVGVDVLENGISVETGVNSLNFRDGIVASSTASGEVAIDVDSGGSLSQSNIFPGTAIEVSSDSSDSVTIGFAGDISQAVFDGNASNQKKEFVIAHELNSTPDSWIVQPATDDASSISHVTADSTNLYVKYDTPPPDGTGNIVVNWLAKKPQNNAPVWEDKEDLVFSFSS